MRTLDVKLIRDLQNLWAQALAIALVLAAGISTLILGAGTYESLFETREAYYERQRFADVFASAVRAPQSLIDQVRAIPGVASAEERVSGFALLDIPGFAQPATARILSLPEHGAPSLNIPVLREGRMPDPLRVDEVIVNAGFADAQNKGPGTTLSAVLEGRKREFRITGVANSPEFIYAIGPGDLMPDDRRFAILWAPRKAAEAAFDMEGAFNDLSVALLRGASVDDVIDRVDDVLERYGGTGAYARKDHPSHAFIDAELNQLGAMSRVLPPIFLGVAAYLINMTMARLITLEREQIGLLKALGYGPWPIAWHYLKFALVIAVVGIVIGCIAGLLLGRGLTVIYAEMLFNFPFLYFTRSPDVYVLSAMVALGAALLGALRSVRGVIRLAPAVAMAPAPPPTFGRQWLEYAVHLLPRISQLSMMVVRQLLRWPLRAAGTALGLSLSVALLVMSLFADDSINFMIDVSYFQSDRQDATLVFYEKQPLRVVEDVRRLPSIITVEPYRSVEIRLRKGHRDRRTSLIGKPPDADLSRVLDLDLEPVILPRRGIAVAEKLAELLHIEVGDRVEVELLDGSGLIVEAPVRSIIQGYLSFAAYMDFSALNRLVRDDLVVSGVHVAYDPVHEAELFKQIKDLPNASAIALQRTSLRIFRETLAKNLLISTTVYLVMAGLIAFGVVYNSARIRLSERARELASLRVLGFTRGEVSWVLFGEFLIITLVSIPIGWAIGYVLTNALVRALESELYRVPFIVDAGTFASAGLVVLGVALISAWIVHRRVVDLDLIGVLKTRE